MRQDELRSMIDRMLVVLGEGLAPFVDEVFGEVAPGVVWTEIMRAVDEQAGKRLRHYSDRDPGLLLRSMTGRIGSIGFPFDRHLSRRGKEYANELRDVRNKWAHNDELTVAKVSRALDVAEALLREVGAGEQAVQVATLRLKSRPNPGGTATPETVPTAARLTITAIPTVSYAMAHCRIGVSAKLQWRTSDPRDLVARSSSTSASPMVRWAARGRCWWTWQPTTRPSCVRPTPFSIPLR